MTHTLAQERELYYNNVQNDNTMKKIQNLVFGQVRATTLIQLNYISDPTRHLSVNATIIDHIRHYPL